MIFYVYFDPQIISTAQTNGNLGIQALTGILRQLLQNCLLAEFKNAAYIQEEIGEQLKNVVGDFDVKTLKTILEYFAKKRLFVECLDYDYISGISEAEMIQNQCKDALLDLLLLADETEIKNDLPVEVARLGNYQSSNFEPIRSKNAVTGFTLAEATLDEKAFLENYFKKALKYARRIDIIDFQCGEKYKGNYDYTLQQFLGWLKTINDEDLSITFHCGYPNPWESDIFIVEELEGLSTEQIRPSSHRKLVDAINSHYDKSKIRVMCYDNKFAHDRFIVTDQLAFEIGIGMDFLDKGKIRQITISLKDAREIKNLLPI